MAKLSKILFISAPVGAGHIRAAQAVSSVLGKQNGKFETKMANVFDFFNPYIGKMILKIYLKILEIFPQLYGAAYSWGNESSLALAGRKIISGYLANKMENYITEYNPTMIICTHATPAGLVAHLIKKNKLNIPVVAIVTDFVVHRLWIYPEIENYIVANDNMKTFLMQNGIKPAGIEVIGIPVDEKFLIPSNRQQILNKLDFDSEQKTILLMGGGAGMLPMDEIVKCCEKITSKLQIIAVAGNNKNIYNKLCNMQPTLRNKLLILEYVDNVNELMAVSDLIISKPGGMTVAEALSLGLPMLIFRPIPGQEEANTNYLIKSQAAVRADSLADIQLIIERLFVQEPEELVSLQKTTLAISQPRAALLIAKYISSQMCTPDNKV